MLKPVTAPGATVDAAGGGATICLTPHRVAGAMARASVLAPLSAAGELPHSLQSVVSWKFSVKPPAEPTPTRKAPRTPLLDGFDTPLSRPRRRNQESRGEASLKHTQFMTSLASGHLDPLTMVSSEARVLHWL